MSDNDKKHPRYSVAALDAGQLDIMWQMLQLGQQRSNIPALKNYLDQIRQALIQKTAGQRNGDPRYYTDWQDFGTICNCAIIETMCLYLSGDLDKLETLLSKERDESEEGA